MRLEHRSSSFDRKHPDIFVKPGSDRMPADQGPTGVLDPTFMRPAGLSPFGLVLAAELELTLAGLAALRFPLGQLLVAWISLPRALSPAPDLPFVLEACPRRDKSARQQLVFRTTDASLSPRLAGPGGGGQDKVGGAFLSRYWNLLVGIGVPASRFVIFTLGR